MLLAAPKHEVQSAMQRAYLHLNACLPFVVMVICLGLTGNIISAIFIFQLLCMVILPSIYICFLMTDGPVQYAVLLRRLLKNWRKQLPLAFAGFFICLFGGFGGFLFIQSFHVVKRNEVVHTAEADGINEDSVNWGGCSSSILMHWPEIICRQLSLLSICARVCADKMAKRISCRSRGWPSALRSSSLL